MIHLPRFPSFHSSFIYFIWLKKQTKPKACSQLTRTPGILCASKSKLSTPWSCTQTASQVTQHCSSEFIWEVFTAQVIAKESFPKGNCGRAALDGTTLLLGTLQSNQRLRLWTHFSVCPLKNNLIFFGIDIIRATGNEHWHFSICILTRQSLKITGSYRLMQSTPQGSEFKDSSGPVCSDSSLVHGHALCHLTPCYI